MGFCWTHPVRRNGALDPEVIGNLSDWWREANETVLRIIPAGVDGLIVVWVLMPLLFKRGRKHMLAALGLTNGEEKESTVEEVEVKDRGDGNEKGKEGTDQGKRAMYEPRRRKEYEPRSNHGE
jgi:hypothetical protein